MISDLVTILMPAYNGATYLQKAIDSVLAQTHAHWELIIVDDGSTDDTAAIVARYDDKRIRYTYQANRGQAAALNRGLELAQGQFVTTLDTDDWFTPNSLFDRVNFLNAHPEFAVVYGDGYYCDVTGKLLKCFSDYRLGNISGDVYDHLIATPFFGTGGNVMVRRAVFDQYQLRYDETIVWCQDHDLYIRIAEKVTFGLIDTATIWYRIHDANMTKTMPSGRRLESLMRTKRKVLASDRFRTVAPMQQVTFFEYLLLVDLCGQLEEQQVIFSTPQFQALSKSTCAKLLRLAANDYLLRGHHVAARTWLRKAWRWEPFNVKTVVLLCLAHLHLGVAQSALRWWRRLDLRTQSIPLSPFEMSTKAR